MRRLQGWAPQIHARRNIAARPLGAVAAWPRRKAGAAASHAAGCHCKFWHRLRRLRLLLRRGLSRRRQGRHIPIAARQRDLGRRPRRIQRHRGERMRSTGGRAANGATSSIVGGSHGRLGSPQCATAGCSRVIGGRRGRVAGGAEQNRMRLTICAHSFVPNGLDAPLDAPVRLRRALASIPHRRIACGHHEEAQALVLRIHAEEGGHLFRVACGAVPRGPVARQPGLRGRLDGCMRACARERMAGCG